MFFYIASCTTLDSPVGGAISLTTSGTTTSSVYTCDLGYSLDGVSESTCQSDGTWNVTTRPTCGMNFLIIIL